MARGSESRKYHIRKLYYGANHAGYVSCGHKERLYPGLDRYSMLRVIRTNPDKICPDCWAEVAKQVLKDD